MSSVLTPKKTNMGWAIQIPDEFAQALGIVEGSIAVLYANEGRIESEILPPPSPELKKSIERISEKYKEVFAELKRLGD